MFAAQDNVARACAELRRGAPVVLQGPGGAAALAISIETLEEARFEALMDYGPPIAALSARRAESLRIRAYDEGLARVAPPPGARLALYKALGDPQLDLASPMKGPFESLRGESGVSPDLARLAIDLSAHAGLLPAALLYPQTLAGALAVSTKDWAAARRDLSVKLFAQAKLPLALAENARLYGFRPSDGGPDHFAIMVGAPDNNAPLLTRLHSECFTGDLLGSLKCDCGPQLRVALARIAAHGSGALFYLAQEGRGIGMANKLRAYALQDQGYDTVDANKRLGFEDDQRDFRIAALMLAALGHESVILMSNNPRKAAALKAHGIEVAARAPLIIAPNAHNADYLRVKATRSGHLL